MADRICRLELDLGLVLSSDLAGDGVGGDLTGVTGDFCMVDILMHFAVMRSMTAMRTSTATTGDSRLTDMETAPREDSRRPAVDARFMRLQPEAAHIQEHLAGTAAEAKHVDIRRAAERASGAVEAATVVEDMVAGTNAGGLSQTGQYLARP